MAREILFRGQRKTDKTWIYGNLLRTDDGIFIIQSHVPYHRLEKYEVSEETVCQYTGLTDKNGRKIFEGDIVKAVYKPKDEDLTIDDFIIKWDKYYCKFVGHYVKKENVYNPLLFGSQNSFEVIGNIFYKPELIGEQP